MCTIVNVCNKGIIILPTHRYVKFQNNIEEKIRTWENYFHIKEIKTITELREKLKKDKNKKVIGIYYNKKYLLLYTKLENIKKFFNKDKSYEWNTLDVNILHNVILNSIEEKEIEFIREWELCIKKVDTNKNSLCFFLNPTEPDTVLKIAKNLEKLPQKSTDFYPKLPSGLILNKMRLKNNKPQPE